MVVVFFEIEKRPEASGPEYQALVDRMNELVEQMPGYISSVDYVAEDGREISLVRFDSLESLETWRKHPEHLQTQKLAREKYYAWYHVEILTTVREYSYRVGAGRTKIYPSRERITT